MNTISQTPTITAGAYSAGDAVGGKLTFTGCPESGFIETVTIVDKDEEGAALNLVLFKQDFTAVNDNAAFDVTAGEEDDVIGVVTIAAADFIDVGGCKIATISELSMGYKLTETSATKRGRIYGQLMTTGTPTYTTTSDLVVNIAVRPG
jgi:hypothetical protein